MQVPFEHTLRSLERQPGKLSGWFLASLFLLVCAWLFAAFTFRIPIAIESTSARLVAAQQSIDLKAPRALPVRAVHVELGADVQAGNLLVELDTGHWRAVEDAAQQEIVSLKAATRAVQQEIDELLAETMSQRDSALARTQEIEAEIERAEARLGQSNTDLRRLKAMKASGAISERELAAAEAAVAMRGAEHKAARARLNQQAAIAERERAELRRRRAGLARQAALLDERRAEKEGEARRARALDRQGRIVAPTDGRVGAIASLAPGTVVDTAEWMLTLVPATPVSVEARFESSAIGQLTRGQIAWLRIPTGQRGLLQGLELRLDRVANEAREGQAFARFSVVGNPDQVELQHGLEGNLVVEVRREPAVALLLEALERKRPNWL